MSCGLLLRSTKQPSRADGRERLHAAALRGEAWLRRAEVPWPVVYIYIYTHLWHTDGCTYIFIHMRLHSIYAITHACIHGGSSISSKAQPVGLMRRVVSQSCSVLLHPRSALVKEGHAARMHLNSKHQASAK